MITPTDKLISGLLILNEYAGCESRAYDEWVYVGTEVVVSMDDKEELEDIGWEYDEFTEMWRFQV